MSNKIIYVLTVNNFKRNDYLFFFYFNNCTISAAISTQAHLFFFNSNMKRGSLHQYKFSVEAFLILRLHVHLSNQLNNKRYWFMGHTLCHSNGKILLAQDTCISFLHAKAAWCSAHKKELSIFKLQHDKRKKFHQ